jgi:peptidoglycan pentaglycine glycine transferase (the first glycine)
MDAPTWNSLIALFPFPHILQTWEWGDIKSQFGWLPSHVLWYEKPDGQTLITTELPGEAAMLRASALILKRMVKIRGLPTGLSMVYVPKGPLLDDWGDAALRQRVFEDLMAIAKRERAIFIKIDPDVRLGTGIPGHSDETNDLIGEAVLHDLRACGWHYSGEQIQFANTFMIDLGQDEEQLLARLKQKTRYNIRLAERKGVEIRPGSVADMELLYHLYAETSLRDGFVIRSFDYYQALWSAFLKAGMARIFIAEVDREPVAALVLFLFQRKAWFLYGMSRDTHREKMPNYLLQWEAIRQCKRAGCLVYDLWGAPYQFVETDPLWGVYRFKEGLGGQVVRHIGAWDLPVQQTRYRLFTQVLPRVLDKMRARGVSRTQQSLSDRS